MTRPPKSLQPTRGDALGSLRSCGLFYFPGPVRLSRWAHPVMSIYLLALMLLVGCASRPSNWQTFDAGNFSFSMPLDLQKTSARGIDSYVCEFESPRMKLGFDDGMYSGNLLEPRAGFAGFMSHHESIDGHDVQIASFDVDERVGGSFHHIVIANFLGIGLTMDARCNTTTDRQTATQIFRTVRFK